MNSAPLQRCDVRAKGDDMTEKEFPVLWQGSRELHQRLAVLACPHVVPWAFVAERTAECLRYHDQTPEELARRGGLAPEELLVIREGGPLLTTERIAMWHMPPEQSVPRLKDALLAWEKET